MATVFITGCDQGLGETFAVQYASAGHHVVATCLEPARLLAKHRFGSNVDVRKLDVTDHAAVLSLADELEALPIDILLNNAGVPGPHLSLQENDVDLWRRMLEVNLVAPLIVSRALLENVSRSSQKVIAFVSSRMGSIGLNNSGGSYAYRSSKAGLNMIMKSLAIDLAPQGICVLAIHPGKVDGNGLSAADSVKAMRQLIDEAGPHQTGTFYNYNGQILPW